MSSGNVFVLYVPKTSIHICSKRRGIISESYSMQTMS